MAFYVTPLEEKPQRRGTLEYYFLRVSDGEKSHVAGVGIPEQAYLRAGEPRRPKEVWANLAVAWARHHLEKQTFARMGQWSCEFPDVPLEVADYWVSNRELPESLPGGSGQDAPGS